MKDSTAAQIQELDLRAVTKVVTAGGSGKANFWGQHVPFSDPDTGNSIQLRWLSLSFSLACDGSVSMRIRVTALNFILAAADSISPQVTFHLYYGTALVGGRRCPGN